MKRVVPWRLAVVVVISALIVPLSGCWNPFAPPDGDPQDPVDEGFRERTSPENVIHNLTRAYEQMDAEQYLACLADTFTFWLYPADVHADPTLPWYWLKADEVQIAESMFGEGTDIDYITLTLTQHGDESEIPAADPLDPSSWQYEHVTDLSVYIDDLQLWANAGARFLFSIDPHEPASSGGDLWEIAVWHDIVISGRGSHDHEGGEEISIGRLKARYRN